MTKETQEVGRRERPLVAREAEPRGTAATPAPLSLRTYVSRCRAMVLGITLTIFAVFLPTVIVPYAFSDDYSILWMAVSGQPSPQFGKNILDAAASEGRPFVGILDQLFFSAAGTIDNLRFVRLFAVLGIIAVAILLHWALVRSGFKPALAALIAVFVCTMPAFQVEASWTVLFSVPFAALLGGAASLFAVATVDAQHGVDADRFLGATGLLTAGLLIYQPGAMFFWVFLAVALAGARDEPGRALRVVRAHFAVAGIAFAVWYLILKLSIHVIGENATGGARSTLTHDVVGKAHWFFHEPLYRSLNLFDVTPSRWLAAVVAIVAAGGMLLWLVTRCTRPMVYVVTLVILIPLSYLPNLVANESWAAYRTQLSISSLIVLYLCFGAIGFWLVLVDWLKPRMTDTSLIATTRIAYLLAGLVVGVSAFAAAKNISTLLAEPHMTELRALRSQVANIPSGAPRVAFVETSWYGGLTNLVVYDEFGFPSTARPWVLEPSVDLILREEGRLTLDGAHPTVDVYPWNATDLPKDEPVVDLRAQLQSLR